ncbi:MAG: tyrosine-type recombinase/integrase [Gammaproteobacteria bacterium]|nr:tyrosine-type recombinase/integrase [Gammaproteobacteria bacterium]MDJ0893101.1 tyrosine-type recombinase/integrase [Gammaproteobacteria bacterium]
MNAQTNLRAEVNSYLTDRRRAGYALRIEGQQLLRFAQFAEQSGHQGPLTLELAVRWATASGGQQALTAARRIEVLRPFARYCQQFEPDTEVPPMRLFGGGHRRLTPHIYTEAELRALLDATAHLFPPGGLRGACCRAIFGLLASTGLRLSEATGLQRGDVDLDKGLLQIRGAKFGKSRFVPMHPTTTSALKRYVKSRDRDPKATQTEMFFVGDYGRPARSRNVEYAFQLLRRQLRWKPRGQHPAPRIQDLRHTFICRTLQRWYEEGGDMDRNILALSTYVGHAKVTDTYWYVTATPELMAIAARRFERFAAGERS